MKDLNKLRSEFEAWFTTTDVYKRICHQIEMCGSGRHQDIFTVFQRDDWREENYAQVSVMASWLAWQEKAKAQVAPENHLLIPKDKVRDLVTELEMAFEANLHLTISDLLPLQQDLKVILETSESGVEG